MALDKTLDDLVGYGAGRRRGPPQRRGSRVEPYAGGRSRLWSSLVETVRSKQRLSFRFVRVWRQICDDYGSGEYDPAKYGEDFLRSALEELAGVGAEDGGSWGAGHRGREEEGSTWSDWGSRNAGSDWDRPRRDGSASKQLLRRALDNIDSRSQSLNHKKLVEEIKELQRADASYSRGWRQFCDDRGQGKYDPSGHDVSFLQAALLEMRDHNSYSAPTPRPVATGYGEVLAERVKQWQRSSLVHTLAWRQYCDERSEDRLYDPSLYDEGFLRKAISVLDIDTGWGGGASYPSSYRESQDTRSSHRDDHASLVEEVKATQQQSAAVNDVWRKFCEEHGDGKYDPSRHDASFLRAALDRMSYGEGRAYRSSSGGGGATGGPLTERVKEVQRSSLSATKAWREFCEARGDGTYDPAHYDGGFLREWLDGMEGD